MRSRSIARLLAFCFVAGSAIALQEPPGLLIEYPITNYRIRDAGVPDKAARAREVVALRERLGTEFSAAVVRDTSRFGGPSAGSDAPLFRVVPPIRVLWNDPRYLFRDPLVVEWVELADERSQVLHVWVTASNQSTSDDARIIGWCTEEAYLLAGEMEERGVAVLRTAGVTLIGSPWHYSFWWQKLHTGGGAVVGLVLVAFLVWSTARFVRYRHERRMRHEQLMARLHRASPYKPRSIDDDTQ
jgi:hypothetical protein